MKKSSILNFFYYMIAIVLIINCRSIWTTKYPAINSLDRNCFLLLLISAIAIILLKLKENETKIVPLIIVSMILILYFGIYILGSTYEVSKGMDVRLASSIIILMWVINFTTSNDYRISAILVKYKNLMVIIAIVSLFYWIFGTILHILHANGSFQTIWTGTGLPSTIPSYDGIYFETQSLTTSYGILQRNSAIFTEGPMAALNFGIALLIENFQQNESKRHKFSFFILCISIISTLSTTGYILLAIVFCYDVYFYDKFYKYRNFLLVGIIAGFLIVIVFLLKEKFNVDVGSSSVRLDDYVVGVEAWKQHPFLGNGVENNDYLKQFMGIWRWSNTGFSNSITKVLSDGGIYLFIGYMFCFIKGIVDSIKTKNKEKLLIVLIVLFLFITTAFPYTYLLFFLLVWFTINEKYRKS